MKKQSKTKFYEFDVPLYPRKLWIAIGKDVKTVFNKINLANGTVQNEAPNAVAFTTVARDTENYEGVLIWLIELKEMTPGVIAHEALHTLDYIMWDIHHGPHNYGDDNEPDAYLIEWIVDKVTECLTKYKKK